MTEFFINGTKIENEEKFVEMLDEAQEYMIEQEKNIAETFGVSADTASAIFYLRTRSRWSPSKEKELVDRDHMGNSISLGDVLSGAF